MTIGIAAWGPDAGHAVFEALKVAERVGRGSIGGFAVFVAIAADGRVIRAETQRGGTATLFLTGDASASRKAVPVCCLRASCALVARHEITAAFDWQNHTVRGALAGALKKNLGLTIESKKVEGRGRVYRLA